MQGAEEEMKEKYKYFMHPDPAQRKMMGPIHKEMDEVTGRVMRWREARIGMMRGASEESLKPMRVYLDPVPHVRVEGTKQLQGWYQNKVSATGRNRPRPCMTDAVLTQPYGGACLISCRFSLPAGEMVDTPNGVRAIESIKEGDVVWGRAKAGVMATLVVGSTKHWKEEGHVMLVVSDGRVLRMTADHPVYSADQKMWVDAGTLKVGEALESIEDYEILQNVPQSVSEQGSTVLPSVSAKAAEANICSYARQSTWQIATQTLQILWCSSATAFQESLRWLRAAVTPNSLQSIAYCYKPTWLRLAYEGPTQDSTNAAAHESSGLATTREHVSASAWPKEPRVACGPSRSCKTRQIRLPNVKAQCFHGQAGPCVQNAVCVGSVDSCVARSTQLRVGLRAGGVAPTFWSVVLTRLQACCGLVFRSQGVHDAPECCEDSRSTSSRLPDSSLGSKGSSSIGRTRVKTITHVAGGLYVYDIETTTQNFYQQGVLVHNCYINAGGRGYRGSGLTTVPIGYGDFVRKELSKMKTATAGYFSSFTEPFTPLEPYYHNTENGARAFVEAGLPIFFLSRLRYPDWAVELLQSDKYSYAQKSINTPDPAIWKKLSPGALPLEDHLKDITRLHKKGIYVSIQCNPVIPGIMDHKDIIRNIERLAKAGANHVIVKFVETNYPWAPALIESVTKGFGKDVGARFAGLFTQNIGGQRTIDEDYRMEGHHLYRAAATRCGMTYATCYEYKYARDAAGEIVNKVGVSVGSEFLTGDQCHGHRVPMFTRKTLNASFQEVTECPPSGCLTCGDGQKKGLGPCKSALYSAAKALTMKDFKYSVWDKKAPVGNEAQEEKLVQISL